VKVPEVTVVLFTTRDPPKVRIATPVAGTFGVKVILPDVVLKPLATAIDRNRAQGRRSAGDRVIEIGLR
jgi:hypothetical protein